MGWHSGEQAYGAGGIIVAQNFFLRQGLGIRSFGLCLDRSNRSTKIFFLIFYTHHPFYGSQQTGSCLCRRGARKERTDG